MAEMTLAQLRDAIRFRGDYQNTRKFPNADLNREIQRAFGKFYQIVAKSHQGWWDTEGTVTTTASVAYVAPPTGTWIVNGVDILVGSEYQPLDRVSADARRRFGSRTDQPRAYYRSARGIELLATPDRVYTLKVLYTPVAPALAEDTAREWFNGWEDYVIAEAMFPLHEREGRPLGDLLAVTERIEKQVKDGAQTNNNQEPEYLLLRETDVVDPYDDRGY